MSWGPQPEPEAHDQSAFGACAGLLAERALGVDPDAVVRDYRRRLAAAPWDPASMAPSGRADGATSVSAWRAALWAAAVAEAAAEGAAVDAEALGAELQRRFDDTRLGELAWVEGAVEVALVGHCSGGPWFGEVL